jgi:hypothetical protein
MSKSKDAKVGKGERGKGGKGEVQTVRDLAARDRAFAQRCVGDFLNGGGHVPSNNPRKFFIRCHHCQLECDAMMVETTLPKLVELKVLATLGAIEVVPNTLNNLPDYGHALWLCYHCGGWN